MPAKQQEFARRLGSSSNVANALAVFRKLTADRYLTANIELFADKVKKGETFWEICCALNLYAELFQPTRYLEIGVRRGRSMAQVAHQNPTCEMVACDLWIPDYAGEPNPGPEFVESELRAVGFRGEFEFYAGDSRETVPNLPQSEKFDVITVDGDHSNEGAWVDLENVLPILADRGMLVFDDIIHEQHQLGEVWEQFKTKYAHRFSFVENATDMHGTALAIRW